MKNKQDSSAIWGIFIVSPILSLIFALKNFRFPAAKNIVWAFTIFYGFTYVISSEEMDSSRYKETFIELTTSQITFSQFTSTLYDLDSRSIDVFNPILQFLVSRVTNNYRILFAIYGLIFGFFYSRNIWYILTRMTSEVSLMIIPLLLTFAVISPIWDITGFRFCVSQHIFLFGVLPFLFERKKKFLIFSFLTFLVHFAFVIPILILLLYLIFGNRLYIYYSIFIFTLFITEINIDIKDVISSNLPEVFQVRTSGYTNETDIREYRERSNDTRNWYAKYYQIMLKWVIAVFMSIILLKGKIFIFENKYMHRLMSFAFLFYSGANITSLFPSGGRFQNVANLFSLAFIILYIQNGPRDSVSKKLLPFSLPVFILYSLISIRIGFESFGVFTIFGNVFTLIFFSNDVSLLSIIKQ